MQHYATPGSPAETRGQGTFSVLPLDPHGIANPAKNTWRHFGDALVPGKPGFLAQRTARMSFGLRSAKEFAEFNRGTVSMRVAEMRGGIVNEDAAIVSRWVAERLVGAERARTFKASLRSSVVR